MAQSIAQIAADFKRQFVLPAHKSLTMGKCIVAIDKKREGKESLRAFMLREFGTIDSNAYKPAKVFRDLVAVNEDGSPMDKVPAAKISEATFDKLTAITVHIAASSILGLIEKHCGEASDAHSAQVQGKLTQDLCRILAEHKSTEETLAKLKALKDLATPEPKNEDGEGEGKGEGEGEVEGETFELTPMGILSLLHGAKGKAFWTKIAEHAKANPQDAGAIAEACQNISANAGTVGKAVFSFIPQARDAQGREIVAA